MKHYSVFDYTITLSRKHRHLVVSSPDFGFRVASGRLPLGEATPENIGSAVLQVMSAVGQKLRELEGRGEPHPRPKPLARALGGDVLSAGDAARTLGVSRATLRRMAALGLVRAQRTPGGHLRFTLEAISEYLLDQPQARETA